LRVRILALLKDWVQVRLALEMLDEAQAQVLGQIDGD